MFNVLLPFFLEFLELGVVLESGFFEISGFHVESGFQFMNFTTVKFFHSSQFAFETLVFDDNVLIFVEEVVYFELKFRNDDFFAAELILKLDKFVFELDSHFALIIEIVLVLFLGLLELFPFVFEHKLDFTEILVVNIAVVLSKLKSTFVGVPCTDFGDRAVSEAVSII